MVETHLDLLRLSGDVVNAKILRTQSISVVISKFAKWTGTIYKTSHNNIHRLMADISDLGCFSSNVFTDFVKQQHTFEHFAVALFLLCNFYTFQPPEILDKYTLMPFDVF